MFLIIEGVADLTFLDRKMVKSQEKSSLFIVGKPQKSGLKRKLTIGFYRGK